MYDFFVIANRLLRHLSKAFSLKYVFANKALLVKYSIVPLISSLPTYFLAFLCPQLVGHL